MAEDPDHTIEVLKNGNVVFSLDRRNLSKAAIEDALGEGIDYLYSFFKELWDRAQAKAMQLDEHLKNLNDLLDEFER